MTAERAPADHPGVTLPVPESFFPQPRYNPGAALCFVHVAKAAGTSVRLTIENAFPGETTYPTASKLKIAPYSKPWNAAKAGDDLHQFGVVSAHAGAAIAELLSPDTNLFTWLREPADRALSDFFFFVVQERQEHQASYIARLDNGERTESVLLDWLDQPDADFHSQQAQLVYGLPSNRAQWRATNPGKSLEEAALAALSRMFFIGLLEDQERSLDALCALTLILPPATRHRRNPGTNRPARINFTPDEQRKFDQILAPDRAFYALAREVYQQQMSSLAERSRTEPILRLIGQRDALRQHIFSEVTNRTPLLSRWDAWDPVLGENLDSREILTSEDASFRWRWTGNSSDTCLYFRLPRRTAFDLRIRLAPATPPGHAAETELRLSGNPVPLTIVASPDGRTELLATVSATLANSLPELAELHLHTGLMIDESKLIPYAGTRKLGLAIESISATPVAPLVLLRRRLAERRVVGYARRVLRRLRRS